MIESDLQRRFQVLVSDIIGHNELQAPEAFSPGRSCIYHVSWATYDSRVSERMAEYRVRTGEPLILSDEWQIKITEEIRSIVRELSLQVLAYNILPDHVHIVIVCKKADLSETVRRLKGRTSHKLKQYLGIDKEEPFHLWTQKFRWTAVDNVGQLKNTIAYVANNRQKHGL